MVWLMCPAASFHAAVLKTHILHCIYPLHFTLTAKAKQEKSFL